jgi:DNA-directed RNA polymerase specialized sigma24 family protein
MSDQFTDRGLRCDFQAGIEFLLRQRLGKSDVSVEVAAIIEVTIRRIQTSGAPELLNLPEVIVKTIHDQFPSFGSPIEIARPLEAAVKIAQSVIADMTELEQEILRQHYELRATLDEIQKLLLVSPQTIRETIAKARAKFFGRIQAAGS